MEGICSSRRETLGDLLGGVLEEEGKRRRGCGGFDTLSTLEDRALVGGG
jgi:hypothetical protein